jgi:hypothetical protein
MKLGAFEPYGLLFAELYKHAVTSDSALRAAVATRRLRYKVVNSIYAKMREDTESGARSKRWLQERFRA